MSSVECTIQLRIDVRWRDLNKVSFCCCYFRWLGYYSTLFLPIHSKKNGVDTLLSVEKNIRRKKILYKFNSCVHNKIGKVAIWWRLFASDTVIFCWCHFHRLVSSSMPRKKRTQLNGIQEKEMYSNDLWIKFKRRMKGSKLMWTEKYNICLSDFHATKRVLNIYEFVCSFPFCTHSNWLDFSRITTIFWMSIWRDSFRQKENCF